MKHVIQLFVNLNVIVVLATSYESDKHGLRVYIGIVVVVTVQ